MNSKENQVFNLLLTEYIFFKKLKAKRKRSVRVKPWLKIRMYTSAFNNMFAELMVNDKEEFLRYFRILYYTGYKVFTTDVMLPAATCTWFCTRLLEFSSMSLCKISFSSSSTACLPSSILKENRRNIQKQSLEDVL